MSLVSDQRLSFLCFSSSNCYINIEWKTQPWILNINLFRYKEECPSLNINYEIRTLLLSGIINPRGAFKIVTCFLSTVPAYTQKNCNYLKELQNWSNEAPQKRVII